MKKLFIKAIMLTLLFAASANADAKAAPIMEQLASEGIITEFYTQDFEQWEGSDGVISLPAESYEISDNIGRGNSFKLINAEPNSGDKEVSGVLSTTLAAESIIYKQSVYFTDNNTKNKPVTIFRSSAASNNEMFTLQASKNGWFQQKPSNTNLVKYESNIWYDIVYVINFVTKKYDLYINEELCVDDGDFPNMEFNNFKSIYFMKLWDKNVEGEAYIDDIGLYSYIPYPTATLDKTDIAYDEDEIRVNFSAAMNKKTLENAISVKDIDGNIIKTGGELSENSTEYTISFKEVLKPDMTYTVNFDESIASTAEMNITTATLEFTTEAKFADEMLFRCGSEYITDMNGTAGKTVQTLCFVNDTNKDAMLIAALYCNKRMVAVKSSTSLIKIGEQGRINVPLSIPDDGREYMIKAYIWDNAENQTAYAASAELR